MKKETIKKVEISLLCALILTVLTAFVDFEVKCEDLRENVLRIHILANSDDAADQELKMKIRDNILLSGLSQFESCTDLDSALSAAEDSLDEFKSVAEKTVKENGFDYEVNVRLGKRYFETREYDDFTLPAGVYDSLIVEIGKAEGKNWWCVMFPSICVPSCTDASLRDTVDSETAEIAENPQNYQIRFKTVEIYQYFKKIIGNR